MSRGRSRTREAHHGLGLLLAAGALLMALTGLGLQHPQWWGRTAPPPAVAVADPAMPGRVLRASAFLLEESTDGGATWRELPALLAPARPVAMVFASDRPDEAWLLGGASLCVSRDGGRIWQDVPLPEGVTEAAPATGLALPGAGLPLVVGAAGGWRLAPDGEWRTLWTRTGTRGDRVRSLLHDLHTGRWGPAWIRPFHDVSALAFLILLWSGLVLAWRRRRRQRR